MYRAVGIFLIFGIGIAIVIVLHPWLSQGPTAAQPLPAPGMLQTEPAVEALAAPAPAGYTHQEHDLGIQPFRAPRMPGGMEPAEGAGDAEAPKRRVTESLGALLRRLEATPQADRSHLVRDQLAGAQIRWELRVVAVHERTHPDGQPQFQVILEEPRYKRSHSVWCEVGPEAAEQARRLTEGSRVVVGGEILDMTPRSLVIKSCKLNAGEEPEE